VVHHADATARDDRNGRGERARAAARGAAGHPPPNPAAGLRDLPGWPLLMDGATARRFTSTTRAQFHALVACGLLPPPRELLPGRRWWHREELAIRAARLFQIEPNRDDEDPHEAGAAQAALDAFDPRAAAALRQGRRQGGR
jgi:hypothetical protein